VQAGPLGPAHQSERLHAGQYGVPHLDFAWSSLES
jgi:hypothetical protein